MWVYDGHKIFQILRCVKRICIGPMLLTLLMSPNGSFAQSSNPSHSGNATFTGQITDQQLLTAFCVIEADPNRRGKIVPGNASGPYTSLSSMANGGEAAGIKVNTGSLKVKLIAKPGRLYWNGADITDQNRVHVGFSSFPGIAALDVEPVSGVAREVTPEITKDEQFFDVWFYAHTLRNGHGYKPGTYRGVTIVTCEPDPGSDGNQGNITPIVAGNPAAVDGSQGSGEAEEGENNPALNEETQSRPGQSKCIARKHANRRPGTNVLVQVRMLTLV